ncbi:MAG TPA: hypothetical protein PLZ08_01155 [Bacillota bacterium]|nr:hypothetical protein [Bacillota bacterium]HOL08856.1 hypothetical protein [Bacillota bacterium]HPO96549.1 hypothetical protein [Bacillota bacterium]
MKLKGIIYVSIIATVFLFLPSLALIVWESISSLSWEYKQWSFYLAFALIILGIARYKLRRAKLKQNTGLQVDEASLLLAKQRLVQGEISIDEFRQIKEELQ